MPCVWPKRVMVYEYHCTVQKFNSIDNLIEMHKVHDAKCNYLFGSVKPVFKGHSQKDRKFVFKTNYRLMQVKSIAECSKGSILQYFRP